MTAPPRSRPKVLRVIARLNVGGPARQAILLHEALPERGYETVLVHGAVGAGEASLEQLLGECPAVSKVPGLGAAIRPFDDLRALVRLLRIVWAERPDVIHTHTAKAGTLGRLSAFAFNATRSRHDRCVVVHTYHGNVFDGYFGRVGSAAVKLTERTLARVTDRIIVISPLQYRDISERYRIAPARSVSVIPLGLDLDAFFAVGDVTNDFRALIGLPAESIVFGAVGRLVPIKDIGLLLRALAIARTRADADIRLVVAGDGVDRNALEALAMNLGLREAVRFLGWRHDLADLYRGVDAVALSSRNEGTPVTLIEAMAAGRPVVATAVGGVPDLVTDGVTGLLVRPGDAHRLAEAMVQLAKSASARAKMGAAGREVARAYRKERLLDDLSTLYRDELRKRRGLSGSSRSTAAAG